MVKCGACGLEGHNRANKKCRMFVTLKNRQVDRLKRTNQILNNTIREMNITIIEMNAFYVQSLYEEHIINQELRNSSIVVPRENDKTDAVRRIGDLIDEHSDSMSSDVYKKLLDACATEFNN